MSEIRLAEESDAEALVDLYEKVLRATGMGQACEDRDGLRKWVRGHCKGGAIWLIEDGGEARGLMHMNAASNEIVTVVREG